MSDILHKMKLVTCIWSFERKQISADSNYMYGMMI